MAQHDHRNILPFTAIIGQELMKKALILNAINPHIGGVLIRGEKGTAKSTAVRALAEILPNIAVVQGCPYHCDPLDQEELCQLCKERYHEEKLIPQTKRTVQVVTLPLGATEDRVIGTIDIERALREGIKALEPGILAEANRGILYIDEVNLLDDHIVDLLLDAAAMGATIVEREGISVSYPSRFILVGTMNPEEGELRPQLLDRFGLQVSVEGIEDPVMRREIVHVAMDLERNPIKQKSRYDANQRKIRKIISRARNLLPSVTISEELIDRAIKVCIDLNIRTHRAEITVVRTAKTIAALNGRKVTSIEDVREAMELALPHRLRRKPFEKPHLDPKDLDNFLSPPDDEEGEKDTKNEPDVQPYEDTTHGNTKKEDEINEINKKNGEKKSEKVFSIGTSIDPPTILIKSNKMRQKENKSQYGRRSEQYSLMQEGRYARAVMQKKGVDIAFDATIRASAPNQSGREKGGLVISITPDEIRKKLKRRKTSTACLFVVDASGSMGVERRMESAKGAIFSMLLNSYEKRDRIGLIGFRGNESDLILPLCSSIDLAYERLRDIPTGGKTPLSKGLTTAFLTFEREKRKYPDLNCLLVLITDGRANVGSDKDIVQELRQISTQLSEQRIHTVVIDTESQESGNFSLKLGYCKEIVEWTHGEYFSLTDLSGFNVSSITQRVLTTLSTA